MAISPFAVDFEAQGAQAQRDPFGGTRAQYEGYRSQFDRERNQAQTRDPARQDLARALSAREQQQGLVGSYQDVLAGRAPSVAEQQLRAGQEAALAQQFALAHQAGNPALGLRMASQNAGNLAAQTNQQAALMRAQEQDMARAGLAGLLGQMRGQDFGAAQVNQQTMAMNDAQRNALLQALMGMESTVYQGNLTANMSDAERAMQAQAINAQIAAQNAQQDQAFMGALIGAAGGGLGALIPSGTGGG